MIQLKRKKQSRKISLTNSDGANKNFQEDQSKAEPKHQKKY